eukprot:g26361.t1
MRPTEKAPSRRRAAPTRQESSASQRSQRQPGVRRNSRSDVSVTARPHPTPPTHVSRPGALKNSKSIGSTASKPTFQVQPDTALPEEEEATLASPDPMSPSSSPSRDSSRMNSFALVNNINTDPGPKRMRVETEPVIVRRIGHLAAFDMPPPFVMPAHTNGHVHLNTSDEEEELTASQKMRPMTWDAGDPGETELAAVIHKGRRNSSGDRSLPSPCGPFPVMSLTWKDTICCWQKLMVGRACCFYNTICCPFVLCCWAGSIYCCGCARVYMNRGLYKFCCCLCRAFNCCWLYTDKDFPPEELSLGDVKGDSAGDEAKQFAGKVTWVRGGKFPVPKDEKGNKRHMQLFTRSRPRVTMGRWPWMLPPMWLAALELGRANGGPVELLYGTGLRGVGRAAPSAAAPSGWTNLTQDPEGGPSEEKSLAQWGEMSAEAARGRAARVPNGMPNSSLPYAMLARSEPPAALSAPSAEEADWSVEEAERATSPWRWLWWPAILYLFWSMAHVCDLHFLALNMINIWKPSSIGVGAVVGGEVFNVLVIIGTAVLATPKDYMPLNGAVGGAAEDIFFYVASVLLLFLALRDGAVDRQDALILLLGGVCYILAVIYLRSILMWLWSPADGDLEMKKMGHRPMPRGGTVEQPFLLRQCTKMNLDDWTRAMEGSHPRRGTVLRVRADMRSRLADHNHQFEDRFAFLQDESLVISAVADPNVAGESQCDVDMVYDRRLGIRAAEPERGGTRAEPGGRRSKQRDERAVHENHWHRAGLVRRPMSLEEAQRRQLLPQRLPRLAELGLFKDGPWEVISMQETSGEHGFRRVGGERGGPRGSRRRAFPRRQAGQAPRCVSQEILFCEPSKQGIFLHDKFGNDVTLEVTPGHERLGDSPMSKMSKTISNASCDLVQSWNQELRECLKASRRKTADRPRAKYYTFLMEWIAWFQFPVKSLAGATIPDMDSEDTQSFYPLAFVMSMVWLGILSSLVVSACDGIHADFGIPNNVLGFTVAAAGTSFPNVFSGICVARQGKAGMAVANALGANVQNVFLALAIPWTIQAVFLSSTGEFPMKVNGFDPAIIEIFITLLPLAARRKSFCFFFTGRRG